MGVIAPHLHPNATVSVRATIPLKPFLPVTVIVELADCPGSTLLGEYAEIEQSDWDRLTNCSRQPQPTGLPAQFIAPYVPAPGVFVQLPAGHQTQLILRGLLPSYRLTSDCMKWKVARV